MNPFERSVNGYGYNPIGVGGWDVRRNGVKERRVSVSETLKKRSERSELRFFKQDAFWRGFASAFDLFGRGNRLLHHGHNPQQADYEALRGDWEAIGRDMEVVLYRFEQRHAKELRPAGQPQLFDPKGLEQRR